MMGRLERDQRQLFYAFDVALNVYSFITRVLGEFGPSWTGLQTHKIAASIGALPFKVAAYG